jgi:DNA primase
METLADGRDMDDPKVKTDIAERVLPLIADLPNPIERDTYRQRLARFLHVDERSLFDLQPSRTSPRQRRAGTTAPPAEDAPSKPEAVSGYALEAHCLGVLLRRPDRLYQIDRYLQEAGLARISSSDFQHTDHQAILQVFQESVNQHLGEPLNYVMNSLSQEMMQLADDLLERTSELDPNEERVVEDLMRGLLELRLRNLHQNIDYLRFRMEEAQEQGDIKATSYVQKMVQHTETLKRLNYAIAQYTSRSAPARKAEW